MRSGWFIGAVLALALAAAPQAPSAHAATAAMTTATATPSPNARATAVKRPRAAKRPPRRGRGRRNEGPYGFLPGYRPPHVIAYEERMRARRRPFYALPVARFYRGRWNGGGFGPCYTYTPIGPVWNCGR